MLNKQLKVYADLRWPDKTGIGVVKTEVLRRVPSHFEVTDLQVRGSIGSPFSPIAISRALSRQSAVEGVFWSPGFMPPATCSIPSIVSVHDLIHLRYYTKAHAAYYRWVMRFLFRGLTRVVCCSENTRLEFLEWSGIREEKVTTIYLGVSMEFAKGGLNPLLAFPYVFYPGNHRRHKNTLRLIEAYARSSLPRRGVNLVFTGSALPQLAQACKDFGVPSMVHFLGGVTNEDMVRLYQSARCVAFVSLYEGFGLPIVEAMAAGVPVLTSNISSMPEVGGSAALLVDPLSTDSITHGLEVLTFDEGERSRRVALGYERCKHFTWDNTAASVWNLIESLN